jgi:hypothetical protein
MAVALDLDTHFFQQAQHGGDVVEFRHVAQFQRFGTEQSGTQDRQGRILGAGNGDFAAQDRAAFNQ